MESQMAGILAPFVFSVLLILFGDIISNRVVNDVSIEYYRGNENTDQLKQMIKWNYQLSGIQIAIPTALISLLTMTVPTGNGPLTIILVTTGIVVMFFNGQIRHRWKGMNPYERIFIVNRKAAVKLLNILILLVSLYFSLTVA